MIVQIGATVKNSEMSREDSLILQKIDELHQDLDPAPDDLAEKVLFGFDLELNLEAEIAELAEEPVMAGHRGSTGSITFTSDSLTVMVSPRATQDNQVRVDGWIAPEGEYRVGIRLGSGEQETQSNADGRFAVEHLSPGELVQFVVRRAGALRKGGTAEVVITPAVRL